MNESSSFNNRGLKKLNNGQTFLNNDNNKQANGFQFDDNIFINSNMNSDNSNNNKNSDELSIKPNIDSDHYPKAKDIELKSETKANDIETKINPMNFDLSESHYQTIQENQYERSSPKQQECSPEKDLLLYRLSSNNNIGEPIEMSKLGQNLSVSNYLFDSEIKTDAQEVLESNSKIIKENQQGNNNNNNTPPIMKHNEDPIKEENKFNEKKTPQIAVSTYVFESKVNLRPNNEIKQSPNTNICDSVYEINIENPLNQNSKNDLMNKQNILLANLAKNDSISDQNQLQIANSIYEQIPIKKMDNSVAVSEYDFAEKMIPDDNNDENFNKNLGETNLLANLARDNDDDSIGDQNQPKFANSIYQQVSLKKRDNPLAVSEYGFTENTIANNIKNENLNKNLKEMSLLANLAKNDSIIDQKQPQIATSIYQQVSIKKNDNPVAVSEFDFTENTIANNINNENLNKNLKETNLLAHLAKNDSTIDQQQPQFATSVYQQASVKKNDNPIAVSGYYFTEDTIAHNINNESLNKNLKETSLLTNLAKNDSGIDQKQPQIATSIYQQVSVKKNNNPLAVSEYGFTENPIVNNIDNTKMDKNFKETSLLANLAKNDSIIDQKQPPIATSIYQQVPTKKNDNPLAVSEYGFTENTIAHNIDNKKLDKNFKETTLLANLAKNDSIIDQKQHQIANSVYVQAPLKKDSNNPIDASEYGFAENAIISTNNDYPNLDKDLNDEQNLEAIKTPEISPITNANNPNFSGFFSFTKFSKLADNTPPTHTNLSHQTESIQGSIHPISNAKVSQEKNSDNSLSREIHKLNKGKNPSDFSEKSKIPTGGVSNAPKTIGSLSTLPSEGGTSKDTTAYKMNHTLNPIDEYIDSRNTENQMTFVRDIPLPNVIIEFPEDLLQSKSTLPNGSGKTSKVQSEISPAIKMQQSHENDLQQFNDRATTINININASSRDVQNEVIDIESTPIESEKVKANIESRKIDLVDAAPLALIGNEILKDGNPLQPLAAPVAGVVISNTAMLANAIGGSKENCCECLGPNLSHGLCYSLFFLLSMPFRILYFIFSGILYCYNFIYVHICNPICCRCCDHDANGCEQVLHFFKECVHSISSCFWGVIDKISDGIGVCCVFIREDCCHAILVPARDYLLACLLWSLTMPWRILSCIFTTCWDVITWPFDKLCGSDNCLEQCGQWCSFQIHGCCKDCAELCCPNCPCDMDLLKNCDCDCHSFNEHCHHLSKCDIDKCF